MAPLGERTEDIIANHSMDVYISAVLVLSRCTWCSSLHATGAPVMFATTSEWAPPRPRHSPLTLPFSHSEPLLDPSTRSIGVVAR